jgi:hypothetical protein
MNFKNGSNSRLSPFMSLDIPIQKNEFKMKMKIIIIIIIITVLNRVLFFQFCEIKKLASISKTISKIVDLH